MPSGSRVALAVPVAAAIALAACVPAPPTGGTGDAPRRSASGAPVEGEVAVVAAASLARAFDELALAFEARHPGVDVRAVYDGSSTIVAQLVEGAGADVVALADEASLAPVLDLLAGAPVVFATNTLVIATSPDAAPIGRLEDLADPGLDVVLCAPEVPCGRAAHALLALAGVEVPVASEEQSVASVLTKVEAGEADAGLVYATDVVGRDVGVVVPPRADEVVNRYPIARLEHAANATAADAFVAFVTGPDGRAVLERLGFGSP